MPQGPLAANVAKNPSNSLAPMKLDAISNLLVAQGYAEHYTSTARGNVGIAANSSGVTTSVALATTYVGLCLSSPAGSGKNLVLMNVTGSLLVAPAALTSINLITGYAAGGITAHTTPLTPANAIIGTTSTLVAKADSACTLVGTPAWTMPLAQANTATGAAFFNNNINGFIILPPGAYAAIGTNIAGPSSGFWGSFVWEEVDA